MVAFSVSLSLFPFLPFLFPKILVLLPTFFPLSSPPPSPLPHECRPRPLHVLTRRKIYVSKENSKYTSLQTFILIFHTSLLPSSTILDTRFFECVRLHKKLHKKLNYLNTDFLMQGTSKCDIRLAFVLLNHKDFRIRCCGCFYFTYLKMIERRAFGEIIVSTDILLYRKVMMLL